ncbi:MAG: hypothetical protein MOIL_00856 [Candidatus Methanolliviera sp. GoM_oil]|nr:MAG: hypothetical protein MOIL_00856 [Candidatus Methanolliviera sp. GoM_oil]
MAVELKDVVSELFEALPGEAVYELNYVITPVAGALKKSPVGTFTPDEFGLGNVVDILDIVLKGMPRAIMDLLGAVKESKILEKLDLGALFKALGPAIETLGPVSVLEFLVSILNQLGGRTVKISMALLSGVVELSRPILIPLVSIVLRIPLIPELVGAVVGLVPGLLEVVGGLRGILESSVRLLSTLLRPMGTAGSALAKVFDLFDRLVGLLTAPLKALSR